MRTFTVLSAFFLGFSVLLIVSGQDVQAQGPYQYQPPVPAEPAQQTGGEPRQFDRSRWQQPDGGPPPGNGQSPGGPPWMRSGDTGSTRGYSGRGGPPPGVTPGYQPGTGGMDANRAAMMIARLRSMDANGNGILEPQEIPDSRRSYVNALVTQMGGNPDGPIDLARLERRAMSNAGNQASSSQQPQQPDPTAGRQSRQQATQPVDPLIPPFGESKPVETPTLGFGQRSAVAQQDSLSGRVSGRQRSSTVAAPTGGAYQPQAAGNTNAIKRSAVYDAISDEVRNNPRFSWFFSYDTDQDGQLTMSEYVKGRGGVWTGAIAEEFKWLDRNGDGFITVDEALITIKEDEIAQKAKEQQSTATSPTGQPMIRRPTTGAPSVRTSREGYQVSPGRPPSVPGSSSGYTPSVRARRTLDGPLPGGTQ